MNFEIFSERKKKQTKFLSQNIRGVGFLVVVVDDLRKAVEVDGMLEQINSARKFEGKFVYEFLNQNFLVKTW